MVNEAAEFTEREFLELAARYAHEIGRSEDLQDILLRYALDYTEDPEETINTVVWLLRRQNREYSQEAIEDFLRTNAETHAASVGAKIATPVSKPAQSTRPARENDGQPTPSFPPGWSAGRLINYLRNRDQFRQLEECRQLLQDAAFLRSVRMVPSQRVSAHLLARLLNVTPANVDGIEKGTTPVSPEICDSLIEIFGFHERAAEEFRSRVGIEKAARSPRDSTTTAAKSEPQLTLFTTSLFAQMCDNLRDLLAGDGPVYMGDGATELWSTQIELLEQCSAFLDAPIGRPIPGVEGKHIKRGQFLEGLSATGTGKTDSFGRLATAMNKGIRAPVLILTPRRLLNAQTNERFCRLHGVDEKDIITWDSNQSVRERTRLFQQNPPPTYLIASYQSLFNLLTEHQLDFTTPGSRYYRPLVILDEVPEAIGSETGNLIRETFIDKVLVVGFAAADAGAAAALFRGQAPIYELDIAEGIERDVLCEKLETHIIDVPLDDEMESAAMLARVRAVHRDEEHDSFNTSMFARNSKVISAAVDFHLGYYHPDVGYVRNRPSVFFIDGINAAAQGAAILDKRARELVLPTRAAYVSSDGSLFLDYDEDGIVTRMTQDPEEILHMLDAGEIQVVWNDRMVGIGIDIPNLAACYHIGHSHSLYRLLQEMGRITRKGDGNKTALAFNVCASGTDPYLYEDVLGGRLVESRERRQRGETRLTSSRPRETRRDGIPYMQVPNIRVYASRSDRQLDTRLRAPSQRRTYQPGRGQSEISAREREAAAVQEQSMAEARQRIIRDAEEQLSRRATTEARTRLNSGDYASFGEFLRLLREEKGLSENAVASIQHVSRSTVSGWECNHHNPTDAGIAMYIALVPEREELIRNQFAAVRREQDQARQQRKINADQARMERAAASAKAALDSRSYASFGAFRRLLREEAGLTINEMAAVLQTPLGSLSSAESKSYLTSNIPELEEKYAALFPGRSELIHFEFAKAKHTTREAGMASAKAKLDCGDYSSLGEFLRLLREEQGMTLGNAASNLTGSMTSLSYIEHDTRLPADITRLEERCVAFAPQREAAIRSQFTRARRKQKDAREATSKARKVATMDAGRNRLDQIARGEGEPVSFGEFLRLLRHELGMSPEMLGKAIGQPYTTVEAWEGNQNFPSDPAVAETYVTLAPHRATQVVQTFAAKKIEMEETMASAYQAAMAARKRARTETAQAKLDGGEYNSFGELLKLLREAAGLMLSDVAKVLKKSPSTISGWENDSHVAPQAVMEGYIALVSTDERKQQVRDEFTAVRLLDSRSVRRGNQHRDQASRRRQ
jgi:transcriptional regulator with XRE-family HTH domain/superfamily II DNA or RNA helicase/plasmid maintenance system antidote protein VapI